MGQGRLSSELGLSILLSFVVVCWMLVISCVFIVRAFLTGPRLEYSTNPPHIGVVDHGFMLQGSRGVGLVGFGKGDEARTSTSFRGGL